ncbi:hypothetical protein CLCR_10956 [Cladophialophora carrionii]|uniref:Uncharacterized protein n=1 Tax=Cladophialophora carrionii TaxID=86049 RepID=A0A1C1CVN2_9EURO|nr:hypothetical protein CLCR_10956 [Cladophialophora carrionii]
MLAKKGQTGSSYRVMLVFRTAHEVESWKPSKSHNLVAEDEQGGLVNKPTGSSLGSGSSATCLSSVRNYDDPKNGPRHDPVHRQK